MPIDLSHTQLLLIVAICTAPGVIQFARMGAIHWLWMAVPVAAGVFAVVAW